MTASTRELIKTLPNIFGTDGTAQDRYLRRSADALKQFEEDCRQEVELEYFVKGLMKKYIK